LLFADMVLLELTTADTISSRPDKIPSRMKRQGTDEKH